MAHYFFHFRDDRGLLRDGEGRDFASAAGMRIAALADARSMIADDVLHGTIHLDQRIEVEDSRGAAVYSLAFVDAVTVTGGRA